MTNVPQPTFGPTGYVAPSEQAVFAGVMDDMDAAVGGGMNQQLTSPQGQMGTSLSAIIGFVNDTFLYFTNQVDPNYAQGRMQDAIGQIYFMQRDPALPTSVPAVCTGGEGTQIPAGALARAADGNLYICTDGGIIGSGGTVNLNFECQTAGPIPCPAGTLNQIFQAIPGWDSINNPTDGTLGRNVEGRQAFENRRKQTVAKNSQSGVQAVLGNVLDVSDVLDAYVNENTTAGNITILGATLAPKSLYVAVVGGEDLAVGTAIWSKKSPGCAYNGNTTVTVTDSVNYSFPYPTWNVTFVRPDPLPILYSVVLSNNAQVPADAATQVRAAIVAAFAGADDGPVARIGSLLLATRYISPVLKLGTWAQVVNLKIGSANVPDAIFTGSISATTLTVSSVSSGALAVGQTLSTVPGSIPPGTTIVSGSGSTWTISSSLTVASTAMRAAHAGADQVQVQINQRPTISAANILVTLQ